MQKITKALVISFLTVSMLPALASASNDDVVLPAGTRLMVRLGTTLTSKTNKVGDRFTGMIDQPVIVKGDTVIPKGSTVDGHVAYIKPSGRIRGRAAMRIVLDDVVTPDNVTYKLNGTLKNEQGNPCAKTGSDNEGTIKGCGKSKKTALKSAAIAGAVGAGAGATVGMGSEIDCQWYGNCGGPGMGQSVLYGAGIGAGAALLFNVLKHEKQVILIEGTDLAFVLNRNVKAIRTAPAQSTANSY